MVFILESLHWVANKLTETRFYWQLNWKINFDLSFFVPQIDRQSQFFSPFLSFLSLLLVLLSPFVAGRRDVNQRTDRDESDDDPATKGEDQNTKDKTTSVRHRVSNLLPERTTTTSRRSSGGILKLEFIKRFYKTARRGTRKSLRSTLNFVSPTTISH